MPDDTIQGFHAHVYFEPSSRSTADRVYGELARRFDVELGTVHERPVGPHRKPMFQVKIAREQFAAVVPWLMLNRGGLSILVHPTTDDMVADHDTNLLWLGEALPIDLEFLRRHQHARD